MKKEQSVGISDFLSFSEWSLSVGCKSGNLVVFWETTDVVVTVSKTAAVMVIKKPTFRG